MKQSNQDYIFVKKKITFEKWMNHVDNILYKRLGMCHDDLPDEDYWNYWNELFTPNYMVDLIIRNN